MITGLFLKFFLVLLLLFLSLILGIINWVFGDFISLYGCVSVFKLSLLTLYLMKDDYYYVWNNAGRF